MRIFYQICCLAFFAYFSLGVFAQDNTEGNEPVEPTEELADEQTEAPKTKPVRPASALPRSRSPRDDNNHMQLLASYLPKEGLVWVEHYPESFLGYWQKDRSGEPKGALLILHSEGASPLWQKTTRPLHESLPNHGWATFSLALPDPAAKKIPPRTIAVKTVPVKATSTPEEGEATEVNGIEEITEPPVVEKQNAIVLEEDKPSVEEVIESRLESALRFLHDQGQYNVVIVGSGANAIHAQRFINKITPKIQNPELQGQLEKPIRAMVLVNSRGYLPLEGEVEWFTDPDLPVLDIYFKQDPRNGQAASKRKQLAKQQGLVSYTQVAMNEFSGERAWSENRLSRRIRSFVEKNASGVEVPGVLLDR